jgi:pimeloyl-ACP methyl ester carboxylesterase
MSNLDPVILIHGMWSTPDTLKELRMKFEAQGYEVHSPLLPFHCPIEQMEDKNIENLKACGITEYVNSISELVASLKRAPILVGHSLGGILAQLVAAKHPCEKLILLSSAAPAGVNSLSWSVVRTLGHNLFKLPMWTSTIALNSKNVCYGIANSQSSAMQEQITSEAILESGRAAWQISMWFLYKKPPTKVAYEKITCPVLIMGGTADKITPISRQRVIASKYKKQSTLIEIDGACHWTVAGSYLDRVTQEIFAWLNNIKS